tara:strand:- start:342 stop:1022 length:681 start_codon:yes stop_codon:yes gene_type:complete
MPTINAGRVGYIRGTGGTNYSNAKTNNGSVAYDSQTGNVSNAIMAFFSSGRGGGTFLFHRTYIYFDTSGITGTVTSATLKITGNSQNSSVVVVADGNDAYGGDGNTALATTDFNKVDIGGSPVLYSSQTAWSTSLNSITLNSTALSALKSQSNTIFCVLNGPNDYGSTSTFSTTQAGIAFGTTIQLEYALAASSEITSLNTIARADISKFNTLELAAIDSINTIDN